MSIVQMEKRLGRKLTKNEKEMVREYKMELSLNNDLKKLYEKLNESEYYVPILSDPYGNCFFESLLYHKVGNSITEIRKKVSELMLQYKEFKLPNNDRSLEQLFTDTNEVHTIIVKSGKTKKIIVYDYNEMCKDILRDGAWSRLPTELIMMLLSYTNKYNFIIMSNLTTNNIIIKSDIDDISIYRQIYLGYIDNTHYIPLDVKINDEQFVKLFYTKAQNYLKNMMKNIKKVNN